MMSTAPREDAILAQLPLVSRIARHCIRKAPASVDVADLESIGTIGLIQAAARYDASKGASFATFAGHRIRGAILDQMRIEAPLTRGEFKGIAPGDAFVRPVVTYSSDLVAKTRHSTVDPVAPDVFLRARIRRAVRRLPPRERQLVVWRFVDDLPQKAVARRLGVSQTRASQLEHQALRRLRTALVVSS